MNHKESTLSGGENEAVLAVMKWAEGATGIRLQCLPDENGSDLKEPDLPISKKQATTKHNKK